MHKIAEMKRNPNMCTIYNNQYNYHNYKVATDLTQQVVSIYFHLQSLSFSS